MDTTIIDDDPSFFSLIAIFGVLLSFPLILILSITTCIAYSRTRTWQKEKASIGLPTSEARDTLINPADKDSESELDPDDSDDEAELKIREEKRRDLSMTTKQYFWKQMAVAWKGDKTAKDAQKVKEKEERRKLAKAVAKELMKIERRRGRKMLDGESARSGTELPSYRHAIVGDKKE